MAVTRAIKSRIKSVSSTRQITKAMKMVAVSKLRRTQAAVSGMTPFADKCREMLSGLLVPGAEYENPYLTRREIERSVYVLFVGNRGLCGSYNTSILYYLERLIRECPRRCEVVVVGRWGRDIMKAAPINIRRVFDEMSDAPTENEALMLAEYLKEMYLSGEADEINFVYQKYENALSQKPSAVTLLPIESDAAASEAVPDCIFEPDSDTILNTLLELYLNSAVLGAMLEARCSEHSARMTAMTAASDNTDDLISELNLRLNRARQAQITTEISEIVGGAAALRKKD